MQQYNNHVIRRSYSLHTAKMVEIMANGNYGSYDNYQWYKERERKLAADLVGKTLVQHDPMYFWHGGMSN